MYVKTYFNKVNRHYRLIHLKMSCIPMYYKSYYPKAPLVWVHPDLNKADFFLRF